MAVLPAMKLRRVVLNSGMHSSHWCCSLAPGRGGGAMLDDPGFSLAVTFDQYSYWRN
jgi:hypothetical protein